jgi:hypothetical protein
MSSQNLLNTAERIVAPGGPVSRATKAGRGEKAEAFPETYAMWVDGDCCAPEIPDGCHVYCEPDRAPKMGDYVVIHFTPEAAAQFGYEAWVKRLVMMQRPATSGRKPRYASNVQPCIVVEQLNPQRTYVLDWSYVRAVHWCGGKVPAWVQLIPNPAAMARRETLRAAKARKVEVAA